VLVAYYAARREVPVEELRAFLAEHLVAATLPAFYLHLPRLPLGLSGKVDRTALPPVASLRSSDRGDDEAPQGPTEELLAQIWSDVLESETAGRHDNFFALGGHSLTATRLIARIRGTLGAELPLRALFGAPTIAELAEVVDASGPAATGAGDAIRGDDLPTDLDQLSDAEVDALLARLMSEDEG
jgi:acyl carrier protein